MPPRRGGPGAVLAGGLYLAYGNFPAPKATVEKVLPDARFPK